MVNRTHAISIRGISLLELFLSVGLLAVLGSIGFVAFSDMVGNAKETKLRSDVKALNGAVLSYLASNGDLSSAKTAQDVIAQLKQTSTDVLHNGLRGGFLDSRVSIVLQSEEEANSQELRACWDPDACRFLVTKEGSPGIKAFTLGDSGSVASKAGNGDKRQAILSLAQEDRWIWDYVEATPAPPSGPTVIPTNVAKSPVVAPMRLAAARMMAPVLPLAEPIFSIPPNNYAISNFDLAVTLIDPNPAGSSDIYYRVGFGGWMPYQGASINVKPGDSLQAQAISTDRSSYESSSVTGGNYDAIRVQLTEPTITPDFTEFSVFGEVDIEVSLTDYNPAGTALLQYRLDGGPWIDYYAPFILPAESFPGGADIEGRAISTGSPYYLNSELSSKFIPIEEINLSGNTDGAFSNPIGPAEMLTNLPAGNSSSYFEWGDANGVALSESWMEFRGGSFTDIIDGEQFSIGSLTYYNGTILADSGADTVDLEIALNLDLNGRSYRPYFDFTFELINTVNSDDDVASADFVYLDDARSSRTIVFDGYEFEFELRFGDTTANGFSDFDRFNVIENRDASVNLYGSFNLIGPETGAATGAPLDIGGLIIDDDPTTGTVGNVLYQKEGYEDPEEQLTKVFPVVEQLFGEAQSALNRAISNENAANQEYQNVLSDINGNNLSDAKTGVLSTRTYADAAEAEAIRAVSAATEAEPFYAQAKLLALTDPRAADEAIEVATQVSATTQIAIDSIAAAASARKYALDSEQAYFQAIVSLDDDDDDDD